jgi:hypothetical protein
VPPEWKKIKRNSLDEEANTSNNVWRASGHGNCYGLRKITWESECVQGIWEVGVDNFILWESIVQRRQSVQKTIDRLNSKDMSFATATLAHVIWYSCFQTNRYTYKQALTDPSHQRLSFPSYLSRFHTMQVASYQFYTVKRSSTISYTAEIGHGRVIWSYIFKKKGI